MEMEGESVPWDKVKDKPMKISLNLETAIWFLKGLGADIEKINGVYWIKINHSKDKLWEKSD